MDLAPVHQLEMGDRRFVMCAGWRNSSAIGGWLEIVDTTVTRTPLRCTASTKERKSPSPENSMISPTCPASSIAPTVSSMSMLPFTLASAVSVDEFLAGLGDNREAVVVEPVDQRPD